MSFELILPFLRPIEGLLLDDSISEITFNTGHSGALATIYANSAEKAVCRFANLVMRGHAQTTFSDTEAESAEAVDFVVNVERQRGRRTIREVLRLNGYDRRTEQLRFEAVYGGEIATISGSLGHV